MNRPDEFVVIEGDTVLEGLKQHAREVKQGLWAGSTPDPAVGVEETGALKL